MGKKPAKSIGERFFSLSRWENEGGAQSKENDRSHQDPEMNNAELVQLACALLRWKILCLRCFPKLRAKLMKKCAKCGADFTPAKMRGSIL